jgi:hypothetical protein
MTRAFEQAGKHPEALSLSIFHLIFGVWYLSLPEGWDSQSNQYQMHWAISGQW